MRIIRGVAVLVAAALLAGCAGATESGETIRVTRDGPVVPVFHPARATDNTYPLLYLIYDPLVGLAPDETTVEPRLAKTWTVSDDAKTFVLDLREDVSWQDGEPFTAEDVVFTATWFAQNPEAYSGQPAVWGQIAGASDIAGTTAPLTGVTAPDEHTVEFTLSEPNASFLTLLANAPNVIVPEHLLADETGATLETSAFVTDPVGTGPFKFTTYETDQFVEFSANEAYFGGAPESDRLIWKTLSGQQISNQLESGEVDVAFGLAQENRTILESNPDLDLIDSLSVGMVGLFIRTDAPALADPRVRQALYYAIDRQALIDQVLGGKAEAIWNPPALSLDKLNQYAYDPVQAETLLAEAGWDPSTELRLVYWKDAPVAGQALPIIQEQLAAVGVSITLSPLEVDDWDDMVTNPDRRGEWDLDYEFGGTYGLGPDYSANQYSNCGSALVQTGYQNCALAALFTQARSITDAEERAAVYEEIASIINDAADVVYLWQPLLLNAVSVNVTGVEIYPFDRHSFLKAREWAKR